MNSGYGLVGYVEELLGYAGHVIVVIVIVLRNVRQRRVESATALHKKDFGNHMRVVLTIVMQNEYEEKI